MFGHQPVSEFCLNLSNMHTHANTAIDYVIYLQNQSRKQEEQLENLEKEVKALKIMKE